MNRQAAIEQRTTMFPTRVLESPRFPQTGGFRLQVLRSGRDNMKLTAGCGHVLVGRHTGQDIYTKTGVERAECPSCPLDTVCYGNNSRRADRHPWTPANQDGIIADLTALNTQRRPFMIRWNVLGDLDPSQIVFLHESLQTFQHLNLWGYTHWPHGTETGDLAAAFTLRWWRRAGFYRSDGDPNDDSDPLPAAVSRWPDQPQPPGIPQCPEETGMVLACNHCGRCLNLYAEHPAQRALPPLSPGIQRSLHVLDSPDLDALWAEHTYLRKLHVSFDIRTSTWVKRRRQEAAHGPTPQGHAHPPP